MNIEEFRKKLKPKKTSNLKKFEVEIKELLDDGYSQKSICEYLKLNGVVTTQQNISRFCKTKNINLSKTGSKKLDETKKEVIEEERASVKDVGIKLERKGKNLEIEEVPSWALN